MNRKELVEVVTKAHPALTKKDITAVIESTFSTITTAVKKGNDVRLTPFGTFTKRGYAARNGVNPSTGEKIKIAARVKPIFKPSKAFTTLVN